MENKCKRFLSLLLAFVMVLGMFPMGHVHVHAAEAGLTPVAPEAGKTYVICFKADNGDYYAMTSTYAAKNNHGTLLTEKVTGTYNEAIGWNLVAADDNGGYYLNAADDGHGLSLNGTTSNDAFADANHPAEIMTLEPSGDGYLIKNPSNRYVNALGAVAGNNSWGACGNWESGTTAYFFEIPEISINLTEGETYEVPGVAEALNVTDNEVIDVESDFVQSTVKNHKLATTIEDGVYVIVNTRSNRWLLNTPVDGAKKLQNVAGEPNLGDNAYLWTVTAVEGEADTYYLGNNGKYLNLPGHEEAELVSDETATVKITASTLVSNAWEIFDTNTYMNDLNRGAVGSYAGNDEDPGSQWVFFKVSDVPACTYVGVEELPSDATITSGNEYLLVNIRNGNKTLLNKQNPGANACLYLNGTANAPSNNAVWTITEHEGSYYIQDQNGKYLTFSSSAATVTTDSTPVSIGWQGFGSHGEAWAITRTVNNRKEYMSNPGGGSTNSGGGWHEENDGGSRWKIYTTSTTPVGTYDVTVTGKDVGEATVVIGMAIYTFHVSANHVHNFVGNVTTPANCVDEGVKTFTCECGEGTYTEVIPVDSKNHKTTEIRPEVKPTLTKEGKTEEVYCTACNTSVSGGAVISKLTAKNAKILSNGTIIALKDSEYVLGGTEGAYSLAHAGTYYVKPAANGSAIPQTLGEFNNLTLTWNDNGSVWIGGTLANNVAGGGSIHIWTAGKDVPYWDRCGTGHSFNASNGTHDLYLFRADANSTNADIPGYTQVTADDVKAGESYLIAAKQGENTWYIMVPTATGEKFDHIAQIVTDAVTHEHEYTTTTTATCGKDGVKTEACDCGHIHTSADAATGAHAWDDATCTAPETCSVCGATKGSALGHTEEKVSGKAPTCTEPGLTEGVKCSVCGTWIIPQEVIPAGHPRTINVPAADATCTTEGNVEYWLCAKCDQRWLDDACTKPVDEDEVIIPARGHFYMPYGVCPPTCTEGGYSLWVCDECGNEIKGDIVPALGHTAGEPVREKEVKPTLNEPGYYESVVYCSVCNVEMSRTPVDVEPLTGAVAEVDGYKYASLIEAVAAGDEVKLLADAYGDGIIIDKNITIDLNDFTYTIDGVLVGSTGTQSCGFQILSGNTVTIKNGSIVMDEKAVRGHDNKVGNNFVIQNYADMTLEDVTVTGNSYTSYVVSNNSGNVVMNNTTINAPEGAVAFDVCKYLSYAEPTVTVTGGEINGKIEAAAKIGNTYYATFEKALASGNEINLLVPVTVTKDTAYDLSGKTIISEGDAFVATSGTLTLNGDGVIKAGVNNDGSWCAVWANGGHVIINGGTYSVGGDRFTTDVNHQNDLIYTKNGGTVTINGGLFLYTEGVWTLNQNDKTGGTITVTGGSFQNWNPANNNSEGAGTNFVAKGYCSALEDGLYVVAEHEYKTVDTDPDCVNKGYTTHTCERCGDEYVDTYVDALGHKWADATCTAPKTCKICKATEGEALGHSFTKYVSDENATCEEDGTKTAKCDRCDETDTETEEGSALGHSFTNYVSDKNATCKEDGTKTAKCDRCDETDTQPDEGSALGHDWVDVDGKRICSVCGEAFAGSDDGYLYVDGMLYTGIYNDRYYLNGVLQLAYELIEHDGSIYFIYDSHMIAKGCTLYLGEQFVAGEYFPGSDRPIQPGYYYFDTDGKMVIPELKNGIVDGDYLYINDVKQTRYTLVEFNGNYYFINDGDKIAKNGTLYLSDKFVANTNFKPGYYYFNADGVMEVKNGVYGDYLYINGEKQTAYQLMEFGGDYYFIADENKVAKDVTIYLSEKYVEGTAFEAGYYYFDAEGKLVVKNGVFGDYLYINGMKQTRYNLVEFDGYFYFINDGDKIAKNGKLFLSEKFVEGKTFADGTAIPAGLYEFDADGKMIIE